MRRIEPPDWRALRDLRLRALQFDPLSFGSTYEREAAFGDDQWREWATDGATGGAEALVLALRGDEAVGLAGGYTDREAPDTRWLIAMWVAPGARRQGVGEALVAEVAAWARAAGAAQLRLWVTDPRARALYERCGFADDGARQRSRTRRAWSRSA